MALTRQKKEEIVAFIKDRLSSQKSTVFTNFSGLSVEEIRELKQELKKAGAEYKVVKKNLFFKALEELGDDAPKVNKDWFEGSLALAFAFEDEVSPAKILYNFAKKNEGKLSILGGILNNQGISKEEVIALAQLPSREQLLAQLVAQINAPVSVFVNVLAGNIRKLVYALNAIKDNKA